MGPPWPLTVVLPLACVASGPSPVWVDSISLSHSVSENSLESEKAEGGWRGRGSVRGDVSLEDDSGRTLVEEFVN